MTDKTKASQVERRALLGTAALAGAGVALATSTQSSEARRDRTSGLAIGIDSSTFGLSGDAGGDQTKKLQAALEATAKRNQTLLLRPGTYVVSSVKLPLGTRLQGCGPETLIVSSSQKPTLTTRGGQALSLTNLKIEGNQTADSLVKLEDCLDIDLHRLVLSGARDKNIHLVRCRGSVTNCTLTNAASTALLSLDALGLSVCHNTISDCGNNGLQFWRSVEGDDNAIVSNNRITRIRSDAGGSGQNGNGINAFRANGLLISNNHITDCAYSAIRGNAASNIQMVANQCHRIGEVALYAEFGFQGAVINSNIIDNAATGISVTNFNEGGRLAVIQGNLIRNLFRREQEPQDKRGTGMNVEADTLVTGNTIENAPDTGIAIGWGEYMRDVCVTGNLVRKARYGILISSNVQAGACTVTSNMIRDSRDGAIRAHERGRVFGADLGRSDTRNERVAIFNNTTN